MDTNPQAHLTLSEISGFQPSLMKSLLKEFPICSLDVWSPLAQTERQACSWSDPFLPPKGDQCQSRVPWVAPAAKLQCKVTQTGQLQILLHFAQQRDAHTCSCWTVGKYHWCFMPARASPGTGGLSLPQNYTEGFVTSFPLSLRHLVGQALSSSLPLPALLPLRLQCPQQWQEQCLYSECLQSALKTPPKLKPERPELGIHERQVPHRKQQLTSLLLSSQVTSQPKGELSVVLALLQDCQCQRAETNHCELHSFLK